MTKPCRHERFTVRIRHEPHASFAVEICNNCRFWRTSWIGLPSSQTALRGILPSRPAPKRNSPPRTGGIDYGDKPVKEKLTGRYYGKYFIDGVEVPKGEYDSRAA